MEKPKKKKSPREIGNKYLNPEIERLDFEELTKAYRELYILHTAKCNEVSLLEERLQIVLNENSKLMLEISKFPDYTEYDSSWKGIEKIIFILKQNGKPMLTKEIQNTLLMLEPYLKQKWDNHYAATMKYISRAIKFERITKFKKNGNYGFTYGLTEWLDKAST